MSAAGQIFLVARFGIALLCVIALVATLMRWGRVPADRRRYRWVLATLVALLLLGIVLVVVDTWDGAVLRRHDPLLVESWLWLGFDAAVPMLVILTLRALDERDATMRRLAEAAVTDPLTGLANRRGFVDAALRALHTCRRRREPASILLFDIDRFKSVNDGHGHAAGDAVLRGMGRVLRGGVRGGDIVGRLGGEEFIVFCPGLGARDAVAVADRVRALLRAEVAHPAGDGAIVTTSAGAAAVGDGALTVALEASVAAADRALYAAKVAGRDRVIVAET